MSFNHPPSTQQTTTNMTAPKKKKQMAQKHIDQIDHDIDAALVPIIIPAPPLGHPAESIDGVEVSNMTDDYDVLESQSVAPPPIKEAERIPVLQAVLNPSTSHTRVPHKNPLPPNASIVLKLINAINHLYPIAMLAPPAKRPKTNNLAKISETIRAARAIFDLPSHLK
jgi:hypothetical protein